VRDLSGLLADPIGFVGRRFAEHGRTYHVDEGGGGHLYVTCDPELLRQVLVTDPKSWRKRGGANDQLVPILGDGLLTADGEVWKEARRKLQPGFRAAAIAGYADRMVQRAADLPWRDGETLDVSESMMALTLDIVCACLFDHDLQGDHAVIEQTMAALHSAVAAPPLPGWLPTPWRRRRTRAVAAIDTLMAEMVDRRSREGLGDDLLSMLIEAGLPPRAVRDQLVTFFLAGHETTSHALSWAWRLLSRHPEARRRLFDEIDALPGDPDASSELPYTDAVAMEALRLFPPAYALPRVAVHDTTLGPYDAPVGTQVVVWVYHAHRDPDVFEQPEAFRPERFLEGKPPASFIPFGAGTRMCIGAGFARLELRLLLATIARRWALHSEPDQQVEPLARVTLSPKGGLPLRVQSRASR
jgi:cytochrome P450